MPLWIEDLQFDEWNEEECARHAVSGREIRQVLEGEPAFFPNKKGHRASLIMVCDTLGGRMLTVLLAAADVEGGWRPAMGWDSSASEVARYNAARGQRPRR